MTFIDYLSQNYNEILSLLIEHIKLTSLALVLAILIGIPIGILISYVKRLDKPIIAISNVIQAIPSMALLGFAIPLLGIGVLPSIVMVVLYSLLPIIKNTYTGIKSVDSNTLEAAEGIGLTKAQILFKIELPLALPIIMAGVRISAVSAVGLMTMAAFIGGGGLGYLVFSGIRTVNNYQILTGALPACLLALFTDYIIGIIEKLVIKVPSENKEKIIKERKRQKLILIITFILIILTFISSLDLNKKDTLVIGGKDFTEQEILCNMLYTLIDKNTDINVSKKCNLGGAGVTFSAIENGNIDLYVDYAGTAYVDILKNKPISDTDKVYNIIKKEFAEKGITALNSMNFNNTYTLAVTKETAYKYNLNKISDLRKVSSSLTISPTLEFTNREDGLKGLTKEYNFTFKKNIPIDGSSRYTALINGESDVVDAFSTDALLKKFNLVVLKDDKNFFPPYNAIPMIRTEKLRKYPEVEKIINKLGLLLTDEVMRNLNYEVDEKGISPSSVANKFLKSNNLI